MIKGKLSIAYIAVATSLALVIALCFRVGAFYYKKVVESEERTLEADKLKQENDELKQDKDRLRVKLDESEKERSWWRKKLEQEEEKNIKLFMTLRSKERQSTKYRELNDEYLKRIDESYEMNKGLIEVLQKMHYEVAEVNDQKEALVSLMKQHFRYLLWILESKKDSIKDHWMLEKLMIRCKTETDRLERISLKGSNTEEALINIMEQHGIIIDDICNALAA